MWGYLTSGLQWKFRDESSPLGQTQREWPTHFVALICIKERDGGGRGPILLLCTPELLLVGSVPLWLRNQREESTSFWFFWGFFWELMHICCGLQKSLCQYEESSSRTDLGWANYTPWRKRWETKVWTDCYYQRVWMFVCFVHVRYLTEQSYEDIPYPTTVHT